MVSDNKGVTKLLDGWILDSNLTIKDDCSTEFEYEGEVTKGTWFNWRGNAMVNISSGGGFVSMYVGTFTGCEKQEQEKLIEYGEEGGDDESL